MNSTKVYILPLSVALVHFPQPILPTQVVIQKTIYRFCLTSLKENLISLDLVQV